MVIEVGCVRGRHRQLRECEEIMDDIDDKVRGRLSAGPQDDHLTLSQGAIIAFRQSGGLRFSTREVTVYQDGPVAWRRTWKLGAAQGERQLTPEDVADLQALI